jgi:glycosyltransferase involved in cell wall biosynthesis
VEAVAASSEPADAEAATRVLLVAPTASGGLARHVIALMRGLRPEAYELAVACDPAGRIADAAEAMSVPVCEMACGSGARPSEIAACSLRLARAIGEMRPHVVHTHSFTASATGALACGLARCSAPVATIHNYPPQTTTMRPRRTGERWALGLAVRRASRLIAVSDALRRALAEAWPETEGKCVTIPNGVEIPDSSPRPAAEVRRELGLPAEGPLVGMVARLAPQKGVAEFVCAARRIGSAWPDAHFVLAGDGPLRDDLHGLRAELGLEGRLHLLGEVESARDLIGALEVLAVASTSEGSSVVAMEAMALSRPVVATAVGGVPEVVLDGETGLLVKPGDPDDLAAAIDTLLRDRERAADMGERGRRRAAAEFDVRRMVERTKAVYADVVREQMEEEGSR